MYTLETLIPDCVGRYITNASGTVQLASLINGRTYAKCWQALVYWLVNQYELGNSSNLAPIGVVVRTTHQLEQDGPIPSTRAASFRFFRTFLDKHGLTVKRGEPLREDDVSTIKMNLATLARLAGVEPQTYRMAMTHLFRRLGEVLAAKEQVLIDFSIGSLIGDKGVVDFLFHDTNEETKTPAPVDPLLLKRGGHWKAPRDTATITPKEKETRALRNKYPLQTTLTPRPPGDDDMNMTVNISSPQQTTLASLSSPLSPSHTSSLQLGKLIDRLPQQPMGPKKTDTLPRSTGAFRRKLKGNAPLRSVRDALSKRDILSPSHTARPSTSTHTSRPSSAKQSSIPVSHRDQQTLNAVTDRVLTRLSSEDDTITGHKRKLSQHQEVNAPPVLDGFARTQAATYTDERYYQSASAKIASFYTPEAAAWSIDIPTGKLEYSGFMPFVPDRMEVSEHDRKMKRRMLESRTPGEIQLEERALSKSLVRYEYYLDHGIDDTLIAPMKEEWIRNGLALLNTNISSISESRVEQLIGNMLIEMKLDYHQSIKRAILDYVLRSSGERQRLSIALPPPSGIRDWGAGELITPPPPEWRQPIQRAYRALSKNLFRNNPAMLSLLDIWQKYKHHLLCDLPTSTQLPITIKQFEMMQKSHLERVRSIFVNEWGEEVEAVFQKYAKEENLTDENSVRFFEAVATVMSNQLRTIIQNSADAYHAFFMAYRNSPIICFADPEHKSLCTIRQPVWIRTPTSTNPELDYSTRNNPRPVFLQKLVVHKNKDGSQKIEYELSLPEMEKAVARIFDAMVSGLGDISRVENKIFSILDETKYLCVNIDDLAGESIWSLKRELTSVFNRSISQCAMLSSLYDEFAYLLDEDKTVSSYLKSPHTLDEYATQIIRYRNVSEQLTNQTHSHVRCPMVMCDLSSVNEILIQRSSELAEQILLFIAGRTIDRNVAICDKFKNVSTTLLKKPVNTRELVDLVKYLTKFKREDRADLLRDCQVVKEQLKFLFDNNYLVGTDVLSHVGASWAWLLRIDSIVKESESLVYHERTKMESHCEERRDNFIKLLERFALQVKQFDHFGDIKKISEYLSKIHTLKENITKAEEEIEALHVQENLLGLTQTDFYVLQTTKAQLAPFEQLWNLVSNFYKQHQAWMRGPVFKLDATAVEAEVDEMWKTAFRLASQLAETAPEPAHVAEQVKKDLALFKPNVPLLHILCNRGMRDRHWSKISDIVGFDLRPDQHTSLARVLDMSIDSHVEQLTEISEAASKEYSIERAVETMKSEWTDIILQVKKWRDTGTHILLGDSVEEVQTLLDDHIVKTQTMRNSPFAKPFIEDIRDWEAWLNNTQEMIEVWLKVQSAWIYLESVMSGEDITKQMPAEGTMFKVVDSNWHKLMSEVVADPKVVNVSNIPHVLGILKEAQSLLDTIETGLNQYLETKRLFFPRFFFLSNDELLEILSETKDPLRVQPHLKKCFDGVNQLEFRENLDIVAMQSREGEIVPMVRLINPVDAKGAVERWLKEFEQVMRETVMDCATKAIKAYTQVPRNDWVMEHPGQIVLAVNHIHWTQNVARAITKNALKDLLDKSNAELQFIVMKVRGELPNLARCTLGALIVTDVHARDVVEHLIANRVTDTSSFEWQSQLRYYYEDNCIRVRMINSTIEYGCEYIGNSPRLVITALTDRCYRTLMGALQLKLGGAPEGPAGTGKTETVKDLSKAVGIQCVVFNCSDGLDFLAMGKFFKGLASSGAWSCFDEFNRIDLEVLSVVAQQIQTIQRAKEMHAKESTPTFMFEGTEIQLRPRCAVFITMNPGYAGRSELPDNLKSQFRPVSMMVPNYGLIAQILLYSYGFVEAQSLSRKIVSCFRLCSEQLSSQDHYDYGMRAVKTVLSAAQHLKQTYPREKESVLILRSIIDVNLPKFLAHDVPLFEGIISDLFPMTKVPSPDYGALTVAIRETITKMNLQPEPTFISKILQLYETIAVRHGLMLVGLPYAGKTMCYRVLAAALGELAKSGRSTERAVKVTVINPKAITISELYGSFSSLDHDWTDGILAHKFREAAIDAGPDRKWLLFDGPVDAVWIENMNSVLDDNKKLCLMSGQIIHMSDAMNIIFEVRDLAVASPATVSRCGMVYMEPDALGWRPIMTSWLTTLPEGIDEKAGKRIETLFDWLVPPCIRLIRTECTQYVHQSDTNLARALMDIFHSLIATDFADVKSVDEMGSMRAITLLESSFLFALIWSVGAGVDTEGRKRFDRFLREVCKEVNHYKLTSTFPKKGLVYEYMFHKEAGRWMAWTETLGGSYRIPEGATFQEILVPTLDTARYQFLLDLFVNNRKPLLFVGPTGVGKSVYINDTVTHLSRERYDSLTIHFSAQTSASATQGLIDDKLDRRRRGVFGPAGGKKCVIFVDDLNLPALDPFGASPPIELLRQYMDHSGWYDVKEKSFRTLVDIQFIAAMGPTGGGRNPVTDRFLRHLATVALVPFDDATMTLIYSTIMKWHFDQYKFAPTITALAEKLVSATKDLYQTVSAKLLPTPAKTHYVYNIRDMSRVFQGLLLSQPDQFDDAASFIRLWLHEVHRVFGDRLVTDADSEMFLEWCRTTVKTRFGVTVEKMLSHLDENKSNDVVTVQQIRSLFFGDYMTRKANRAYSEISDLSKLHATWANYLEEYNALSQKPMRLVMFRFAIEHASRLVRILKQPGGHALLLGVGGSGKQSLTRLAASVMEYDVISIELNRTYGIESWQSDLRKLLKLAGGEGKPCVFLFSDNQIRQESFLEDINGLLNASTVPNLWPAEEMAEVIELVRADAKRFKKAPDGTPSQFFSYFTERVRTNLHIVICMSPVGDKFRERLRMFPSLVACCTIDSYSAWPKDGLYSVARDFLSEVELDESTRAACVDMCMFTHAAVEKVATQFWDEQRRHVYVTPTSYLELITTFKSLLATKRKETMKIRGRYQTGLDKLAQTEKSVKTMQIELEEMQPALIRTSDETAEMMQVVQSETVEAQKIRDGVAKEENIATEAANTAKAIERECAEDLAEAMPILEAAIAALDTLTNQEISEIKAMRNPPKGVKLVMEALCVMKKIGPARIPDPSGNGKMIIDYWEPSKKFVLSDPKLLRSLVTYDKDNIDPRIIKKIRTYMANPEFDIAKIKTVSRAAHSLCSWIYAIEQYDRVIKQVKPKKEALAAAKAQYELVKQGLDVARQELSKVETKISTLRAHLDTMQDSKVELESKIATCSTKLERAHKLLSRLGGEKSRWTQIAADLGTRYANLTGDILLSSAVIAYLGAFTAPYRQRAIAALTAQCVIANVPCSPNFQLATVLGDPVHTRRWVIDGLPNDTFSIDNAIIVNKSRRFSFMIDPQGQASKWIKNMERENKLAVIKANDDYARTLENAIQYGVPVLMENIGEELDPTLEPLLLKQIFKKGSLRVIRFGDTEIEYADNFKFYMTTKVPNASYTPEMQVKVTILNFMITPEGLEDQLLGIVVAKEKPDLSDERARLVVTSASNATRLKEIEDKILHVLSQSKGNILDDDGSIEVLSASKAISNEIQEKQKIADKTEAEIDETRAGYKPVAFHASVLFFCIADLANIDPMYQYSLAWFISLFKKAIEASEFSHHLETRIHSLNDTFSLSLYKNIGRSLFQKDKLLFSFLLASRIAKASHGIDDEEWRFFLTGGVGLDSTLATNPLSEWMSDRTWAELTRLSQFPRFRGFAQDVLENASAWRTVCDSPEPHTMSFPGRWSNDLDAFQRLVVLRVLRPDKVVPAGRTFVVQQLGEPFMESLPFDLPSSFQDSAPHIPIIMMLSPGSDPMPAILKFASDTEMGDKVHSISLGQGQGAIAAKMIEKGLKEGTWLVLQNLHYCLSWMPILESICDAIDSKTAHPDFRLWLTSYPTPHFPVSILQNGVKLTTESPKGMRANLLDSYSRDPIVDERFFTTSRHQKILRTLVFALAWFHAAIQERRHFSSIGFNTGYGFNDTDFTISVRQLHMFLDEMNGDENDAHNIPFKALNYLTGECNYGGRVTDDWDRRTLMSMLASYLNPDVLQPGYALSSSRNYRIPIIPTTIISSSDSTEQQVSIAHDNNGSTQLYLDYIRSLPADIPCEVFGLHENAQITRDQKETHDLLQSILYTETRTTSGREHVMHATVEDLATDILKKLPPRFDILVIQAKYPTQYNQSMNTVLTQECIRFNKLTDVIRISLLDLQKALTGQVVMSKELERVANDMFDGKVPHLWTAVSYPSLKPLGGYINDLLERLKFLQEWIEHDVPSVVWISGLFFTQSFLTGLLQNYARRHRVAIDEVGFDFEFLHVETAGTRMSRDTRITAPSEGAYIRGLYLQGAGWDAEHKRLMESPPKVLFSPAPIIWLKPCKLDEMTDYPHYECPVYRTTLRRGTLSTTGHSTNFVMSVRLPTNEAPSHWVRRGVALISQLDD